MLLVVLVLVLLVVDNVTVVLAGVDEVIEVLGSDTAVGNKCWSRGFMICNE